MKRIVKLTESDLLRLVKKVISEQYFDGQQNIDTTQTNGEQETSSSSLDSFKSEVSAIESEMDNLLSQLTSENTPIDKKRFLRQLQGKLYQLPQKYLDDPNVSREDYNEIMSYFPNILDNSIRSFAQKLKQS